MKPMFGHFLAKSHIAKLIFIAHLAITAISFGQVFAWTGGVIGVVSPTKSIDGKPLLWQNFDSTNPTVQVLFFKGDRFDFMGLVNDQDTSTVYSGLNTAGFGLITSRQYNADSSHIEALQLVRTALSSCTTVKAFEALWRENDGEHQNISFACIDAFGGAVLFDATGPKSVNNLRQSPNGFLIRAGFHFGKSSQPDSSFWRYHRARELLKQAGRRISVKTLFRVSRDIQSFDLEPFELPYEGNQDSAPKGYVRCSGTINQHNTAACIIIQGVKAGENPDFATMWALPGEPLCGVAIPLWPATGRVPEECKNTIGSLNAIIRMNEAVVYDNEKFAAYVNTFLLANERNGLIPLLENVENKIIKETIDAVKSLQSKSDYLEDMIAFQTRTARWTARALRY